MAKFVLICIVFGLMCEPTYSLLFVGELLPVNVPGSRGHHGLFPFGRLRIVKNSINAETPTEVGDLYNLGRHDYTTSNEDRGSIVKYPRNGNSLIRLGRTLGRNMARL